jgi:pyruvate/2-oxoglutarate dehydrogenase complex dihydrolipoamide dehydrogenase (E3) component
MRRYRTAPATGAASTDYEAIAIGTGFGATIASTRLAALGKQTLLVEGETWWITHEALGSPVMP